MSKASAAAAKRFVTAFNSAGKTSVAMVNACVAILDSGTSPRAVVPLVRGAYEHYLMSLPTYVQGSEILTPDEVKNFERLVSQRSFAAQLVRIVGTDAASDDVAIKAALSVASGQLPRKVATEVAERFSDSNDAPGFAAAIADAKRAKADKPKNKPDVKSGQEPTDNPADAPAAQTPITWKSALEFIDGALKTADDKNRAAMLTALKATVLRHTNAPAKVSA